MRLAAGIGTVLLSWRSSAATEAGEGEYYALLLSSILGMVLLVAGTAWLTLAAPVRPRVAQVAFLLVAGFLLVNKVWSPQYSLWLLPLAVLAAKYVWLPTPVARGE